jgi:hypothetical protein
MFNAVAMIIRGVRDLWQEEFFVPTWTGEEIGSVSPQAIRRP